MRTIGVIGANGQVGAEVCLLLAQMDGIRVAPIVRSELGAALLRRLGLECRVGSADNAEAARALFSGCDMVADFSLPRGAREDARRTTRQIIENATAALPAGAPFVYMSTTVVFGTKDEATAYEDRLFARNAYGVDKRRGERLTRLYGMRRRRPVYVLRLGQVHGELQRVSRSMLEYVSQAKPIALRSGGEIPSDTVFCSTIASALAMIARENVESGTYTLLEAPEWTWRELYEYLGQQAGVRLEIRSAGEAQRKSLLAQAKGALRSAAAGAASALVRDNKEILRAYGLGFRKDLELLAKAAWQTRQTRAAIAEGKNAGVLAPHHWDGPVPGRRIEGLAAPEAMTERAAAAQKVNTLLEEKLGRMGHNLRI